MAPERMELSPVRAENAGYWSALLISRARDIYRKIVFVSRGIPATNRRQRRARGDDMTC